MAVALIVLLLGRQQARGEQQRLPTITTAHDAHSLTIAQAAQKYPVHLRVVVTYYDPNKDPRHPACFASDSTGGIYVELRNLPAVDFKAGDLVEFTGFSAAGGYAPIVFATQAHILGKSPYPRVASQVNLSDLLTGTHDGQWVELDGVVHAVSKSPSNIRLELALHDGSIAATTINQPGLDYDSLVDAHIKVRGNTAPLFNQKGQMTGVYLIFPDRAQVTVVDPAPARPFALPVSSLSGLLRFTPEPPSRHRVHIRGTVTLAWPGRLLCIQDGPDNLCAQTDQTSSLNPGDVVDVIGFPAIGPFTPTLTQATYEAAGHQQPVPAMAVNAEQALSGDHDAQLIELEGQIIGQDDSAIDPNIVLSSQSHVFSVFLPAISGVSGLTGLAVGSRLRVVGICLVRAGADKSHVSRRGFPVPQSFRILLRSPQDVLVLERPSWWTPSRAIDGLGIAIVLTSLVLAWVFLLRRQVREQTHTIRQQLSELLQYQHALRGQTLMLKAVLDSIVDGLVAVDEKEDFIIWNPAAEEILGARSKAPPLKEWSNHYALYCDDMVTSLAPGKTPLELALGGETSTAEIFLRDSEDKRQVWLETNSSPLRSKDGEMHGAVLAFRDITRRKADELEIRKLNEGLEAKIGERTAQLKAANRELEAFSYSVSHDLRAPLRHIAGYSSLLLRDFAPVMEGDGKEYLQSMQAAVRRMGHLIDALLSLARLGQQSLRVRATELNPLLHEVLSVLQPECEGREVEWRIAPLPAVECDPILMGQVFQNLLGNALKYSRGRAHAVIEVDSIREPDRPAVIFVRDNGAGFDMKYATKLFGVFQRMHTEDEFEGAGVGLATVQRIIEKHGGRIWAEAEMDRGATFYFTVQ